MSNILPIQRTMDCQLTLDKSDLESDATLRGWIETHIGTQDAWLLAHADTGVVWGRIDGGKLATSKDAFPDLLADLDPITLQRCRVFAADRELMLWQIDDAWHARLYVDDEAVDGESRQVEFFDEEQFLWGTRVADSKPAVPGFTLVADGAENFPHAVPLRSDETQLGANDAKHMYRPLRLTVRHYLVQDETDGTLSIEGSRLVSVGAVARPAHDQNEET